MPASALHLALKEATAGWHRQVDEAYSGFDLATASGYTRFLWAHRIAAVSYQQWFDYFAVRVCVQSAPDYNEMLCADLHDLKRPLPQWRLHHQPWNSRVLSTSFLLGLGYTICGSRLGVAAIHREWRHTEFGSCHTHKARFLGDRSGLVLWQKLMFWCAGSRLTPLEQHEACEAAIETFGLFLAAAESVCAMSHQLDLMEKIDAG